MSHWGSSLMVDKITMNPSLDLLLCPPQAVGRTGVQTVQTRTPVVFSQTIRPQGEPQLSQVTQPPASSP